MSAPRINGDGDDRPLIGAAEIAAELNRQAGRNAFTINTTFKALEAGVIPAKKMARALADDAASDPQKFRD